MGLDRVDISICSLRVARVGTVGLSRSTRYGLIQLTLTDPILSVLNAVRWASWCLFAINVAC